MITLDAVSNGGIANTITNRVWAHTVGAGSNRLLVILAAARDSSGTGDEVVSSVVRDGQSFTFAGYVSNVAGFLRAEVWYLVNPNVNTSNITVTWSGSLQTGSAGAASFFGVDPSAPYVGSVTATGNSTSPSSSLASGALQIANMIGDSSTSNTVDTGSTIFTSDGSRQHAGSYSIGASHTANFTLGGSAQWAEQIISFAAYTGNNKVQVLQDNFNDNVISPTLWAPYGSHIAETGGKLSITPASGGANYSGIESANTYDLTNSALSVRIANAGNQSLTSLEVELHAYIDANNSVFFNLSGGNLRAYKKVAGVSTQLATTAWSSTTKNYIRIRSSGANTIYEYGADGKSWTTLLSVANPITITAVKIRLDAGVYNNELSGTTVEFDDLNEIYFKDTDKLPTGASQDTGVGTTLWTLQDYILADDSTGSDFSALGNSTADTLIARLAHVVVGGVVQTATNLAGDQALVGASPQTYGGNSNLWGQSSLTGLDVKKSTFGFALATGRDVSGVKTTITNYIMGLGFGFTSPDNANVNGFSITYDLNGYAAGGGVTRVALDTIKATMYYTWRPQISGGGKTSGSVYIEPPRKERKSKDFSYDVYSHDGDFLGQWDDVANDPSFKRDINNLMSTMNLNFARNDDITERTVDLLVTESDESLTTEDDIPLSFDVLTATGLGEGTDLEVNHDVVVSSIYGGYEALTDESDEPLITEDGELLVVADGAPDGRPLFTGYIPKWTLDYGDSDDIKANLLAHSYELKSIMLESVDTVAESFTNWDNGSYIGISGAGPGDIDQIAQTFQLGTTKTISRIRIKNRKWLGTDPKATMLVYAGTPLAPGASVGSAIATPVSPISFDYIDYIFDAPITLTALTTYTMEFSSDVAKSGGNPTYPVQFAYLPTGTYANGNGYSKQVAGSWVSESWDLIFQVFEKGGSTTVTLNNYTIDNIVKYICDFAQTRGAKIRYDNTTIDPIDTLIPSFTFRTNYCDEALLKTLELATSDVYMYYDVGTNYLHLHRRATEPEYYAIRDKNTTKLNISKSIEHILNEEYFSGGGDPALYIVRRDAASMKAWRRGSTSRSDSRVTNVDTATILADADIDRLKDPQYSGTQNYIEDDDTWIDEVPIGAMFGYLDFSSIVNVLVLQAMSINYTPDELQIDIDSLTPKLAKQAEDLRRDLKVLENSNNPATPS